MLFIIVLVNDLEKLILEDITLFMKELRTEFSFIDNEYEIKIGDKKDISKCIIGLPYEDKNGGMYQQINVIVQ